MRVVLSGYYGAGNLGDEALLAGLLSGLRARGFEPSVLSADPARTRAEHGVQAHHRLAGLLPAVLGAGALVSGGGGLLQDVTSSRSLDYYLGVLRLARGLGKRVVVYGQSLGPLSERGRARVRAALAGVPVALRDRPSLDLARELGLQAELVADPALLLELPPGPPGRDPEGPVLLVPRAGQGELNAALESLAATLVGRGVPVAAAAFHPPGDAAVVDRLVDAVPVMSVADASSPGATLRSVLSSRYVVSVRLHGCILAARAGVGFAGLSYDPKVRGFLTQAGAPAFEAPVDGATLLAAALAARAPDPATAGLVSLADTGMDWLAASLSSGRGA